VIQIQIIASLPGHHLRFLVLLSVLVGFDELLQVHPPL